MKIGFGRAEVTFPPEVFPNPRERYTGVHDAPLVHAVITKGSENHCFLFADLTDPGDWNRIRREAAALAGTAEENTLIILSHPLTTPHCLHREEVDSPELLAADQRMRDSIREAMREAVAEAAKTVRHMRAGIGKTLCGINSSRVTETPAGYDQCLNGEGETDHTVTVMAFRDDEDTLCGVLYNVNTSPAVMENARLSDDSRLVSGDLASCTSRLLEKRLGGNAIWTTGASADQWPILRALDSYLAEDGTVCTENRGEQGYALLEALSARLADAVARTACKLPAEEIGDFCFRTAEQSFAAHRRLAPPVVRTVSRTLALEPEGEVSLRIPVLTGKDTAIIGMPPEICVSTARAIKEGSGYPNTLVVSFAGGLGDYMASEELYRKAAPQSKKGRFMPGSAEKMTEQLIQLLRG